MRKCYLRLCNRAILGTVSVSIILCFPCSPHQGSQVNQQKTVTHQVLLLMVVCQEIRKSKSYIILLSVYSKFI